MRTERELFNYIGLSEDYILDNFAQVANEIMPQARECEELTELFKDSHLDYTLINNIDEEIGYSTIVPIGKVGKLILFVVIRDGFTSKMEPLEKIVNDVATLYAINTLKVNEWQTPNDDKPLDFIEWSKLLIKESKKREISVLEVACEYLAESGDTFAKNGIKIDLNTKELYMLYLINLAELRVKEALKEC